MKRRPYLYRRDARARIADADVEVVFALMLVLARLVRRSGSAEPGVTVHGSYTDAAGRVHTF
jgi:hypothetical protein